MLEPGIASRIRLFAIAFLLMLASGQDFLRGSWFASRIVSYCQGSATGRVIIPEPAPFYSGVLPETGLISGTFTSCHCSSSVKPIIPELSSPSISEVLPGAGLFPLTSGESVSSDVDSELSEGASRKDFRLIFYNVENLFDTINEPDKDDDEFTPDGDRRWNEYRLGHKINNIYKALVAAAGFKIPAIIGLCEVENRNILERLAGQTGLKNYGYNIIHRNSGDSRGIDVAVLFRPDDFVLLDTMFKSISFPFDTLAVTRDILYVKGLAGDSDTLHILVNHWTSRWGGQAATEPYRNYTASILRSLTDSVLSKNPGSHVVIMGDFNDEPEDVSLQKYLRVLTHYDEPFPENLYNLSYTKSRQTTGTLKYEGEWFLFDQFIVSGSLLDGRGRMQTSRNSFRIFSESFLLIPDNRWFGYKPFRSYEGFRYTGGFSDHLPVVLDLWW